MSEGEVVKKSQPKYSTWTVGISNVGTLLYKALVAVVNKSKQNYSSWTLGISMLGSFSTN